MNGMKNIFVVLLAIVFASSNLVAMNSAQREYNIEKRNGRALSLVAVCESLLRKAPTCKDRNDLNNIRAKAQEYVQKFSRQEETIFYGLGSLEISTWVRSELRRHGFDFGSCDYGALIELE